MYQNNIIRPTKIQANWLRAAGAGSYLPNYVHNCPVGARTKSACERQGWAVRRDGAYWITDAGRAALVG